MKKNKQSLKKYEISLSIPIYMTWGSQRREERKKQKKNKKKILAENFKKKMKNINLHIQ